MNHLIAFTLTMSAATALTLADSGPPVAESSVAPPSIVVTEKQNRPAKGGYVIDGDGARTYVNARCKRQLVAAGADVSVLDWTELRARPLVPRAESATCDEFVELIESAPDPTPDPLTEPDPSTDPEPDPSTDPEPDPSTDPEPDPSTEPDPGDDAGRGAHSGAHVRVSDESVVYSDRRVAETYYLFDPEMHPNPTWGDTRIGWLVECDSVKFEQVDPIVAPGMSSHHLHEFFGNPNVTSTSTTQSLVDTSMRDIRCTDSNDKSAYWSPAAFQDGKRLNALVFKAYYKSTTPDTVPIPLGLRMIAGDAKATSNQDPTVGWFEFQRKSDLTTFDEMVNTVGKDEMITRTDQDGNLVLRINFPNCWDGVNLDSPDHQSHVAYYDEEAETCPATHPVKIPQLTTFTRYDTTGGEGFSLASGDWFTFHQDFWNAWSPDQMAELNEVCILDRMNCRVRGSSVLEKRGQHPILVPSS